MSQAIFKKKSRSPNNDFVFYCSDKSCRYLIYTFVILYVYDWYVLIIVPTEPGLTNWHILGYVIIISSYFALSLSAFWAFKSGAFKRNFSTRVQNIWILLLAWGMINILQSFKFNFKIMAYNFVIPNTAGVMIMPLAMLTGSQIKNWIKIKKILYQITFLSVIAGVIGLFYGGNNTEIFRLLNVNALFAFGFLFLDSLNSDSNFRIVLAYVAFCLFGIAVFLLGSRNGMIRVIYFSSALLFMISIEFFRSLNKFFKSVVIIFIMFSIILFTSSELLKNKGEYADRQMRSIEKIVSMGDSRTDNIKEMWEKSNYKTLIIGRGVAGGYKSDIFYTLRNDIENGYMQFILKGGFIMLILFLLLIIPAAIRGIFRSRNNLILICGFVVLERLVWMFTFGLPWVDNHYLIFWICAGACLAKDNIQKSNVGKLIK